MDILQPGTERDGDVVLDEHTWVFQRVGGAWRHLDMVLVESGQDLQPGGELAVLQRGI
jgi:hypothetical protein